MLRSSVLRMRFALGSSLLFLAACSFSSGRVEPPPPPGSKLPSGWEWPRTAPPQPAIAAGPAAAAPIRPVIRPFDASRLRSRAKKTKGCKPIELGPGKWIMPECQSLPRMSTSLAAKPRNKMGLRAGTPDAIDLRTMGLDGPVKDQQQVGVCWAFTISTLMENSLRRGGKMDVVSPLHIVAEDAWDDLHRSGKTDGRITLETSWPYDPAKACKLKETPKDVWCEDAYHVDQGSWRSDPGLSAEKDRANQVGVYPITKIQTLAAPGSFDELAEVIANGQAIYLSLNIDKHSWSNPPGGVIAEYETNGEYRHAVAAVGYRSTPSRAILIHNSWGADWGAGGYAWVSESILSKHANDAFVIEVEGGGSGAGMGIPGIPGLNIPGLPQVPGIPGMPWPGLPGIPNPGSGQGQPPPASSCPAGQVPDIVTRACAAPCGNGMPPANGFCLP